MQKLTAVAILLFAVIETAFAANIAETKLCVPAGNKALGITGNSESLFVTGSGLKIYDRENLTLIDKIGPSEYTSRVALSDDEFYFAYISKNTVYLYEESRQELISQFTTDNNLRAVHLNNKYLYFGEKDTGRVHRVNLETMKRESKQIATDDIRDIDSRKGRMVIASNDNTVYLIRERDWKIYTKFDAENNAEVALIESKYIIYASDKQKVWVHNRTAPYELVAVLTEPTGDITGVSRDGEFMFVSTDTGLIHVYKNFEQAEVIPASANKARVEHIWVDQARNELYASHGGSDFPGFSGDKEICEYAY